MSDILKEAVFIQHIFIQHNFIKTLSSKHFYRIDIIIQLVSSTQWSGIILVYSQSTQYNILLLV